MFVSKGNYMFEMVRTELEDAVGAEYVNTGDSDKFGHSIDYYWIPEMWHDRGLPTPKPDFVVHPGSAEEVAQVIKIANQYKIPVVTWGGGSGSIPTRSTGSLCSTPGFRCTNICSTTGCARPLHCWNPQICKFLQLQSRSASKTAGISPGCSGKKLDVRRPPIAKGRRNRNIPAQAPKRRAWIDEDAAL